MNSVRKKTKKRIGRSKKRKKVQRGGAMKALKKLFKPRKTEKTYSIPPASGLGVNKLALVPRVPNPTYESAGPPTKIFTVPHARES